MPGAAAQLLMPHISTVALVICGGLGGLDEQIPFLCIVPEQHATFNLYLKFYNLPFRCIVHEQHAIFNLYLKF